MRYCHLGRSGLSVSRLCLGTMNFGPLTNEDEAHRIMDAAHDAGINFFDTSNTYGLSAAGTSWVGEARGATEAIIGRWFAQGNGRRERTVLATKLFGAMGDWPNEGGLSALNIRRALDASLRRLQTDHIDLYQFHRIDHDTPWDEIWQALDVAITAGKVLYVGSCNFAGWHIAHAQEEALRRGLIGLSSEQSIYNLITRHVEIEVIPALRHYGMALLPWSPLNGGLLGGVLRKTHHSKRRTEGRAAQTLMAMRSSIEAYEALAAELGHAPSEIALAWLLHQPTVAAPVVGPRTHEQLVGATRALDVQLDAAVLDRLGALFPGFKTAPELYAD